MDVGTTVTDLYCDGTREQYGDPGDAAAPNVAICDRPAVGDESEDANQPARDDAYARHVVWRGEFGTGRRVNAKSIREQER